MIVATTSGQIELSPETVDQLTKRLSVTSGSRPPAASLAATLTEGHELDDNAKCRLFDELTFWLDNPGSSGFPPDARALFRALAGELTDRGLLRSS